MRPSALAYLYARRLRTHPAQELLAAAGIAIGVALVFAVQVATGSIADASEQIIHGILGPGDLQLRARGEAGFDEALAGRVGTLPGVRRVVRGVAVTGRASAADGRALTVQLASADLAVGSAAGVARDPLGGLGRSEVILPAATAARLGVSVRTRPDGTLVLPTITLMVRGRALRTRVAATISREAGPVSGALAVFASLHTLQALVGMPGRLSGILIRSSTGAHARVKRELERSAPAGVTVTSAGEDIALLRQATAPDRQATGFFALVAALVGLLLAFNATLLSAPERRRMVADLRLQGVGGGDIARLLMFQAVCLGLAASLVGVVLGDVLSRAIFRETPGYLAAAFPLGTQTVIHWPVALLSVLGGVLAACLASAPPLLDLRRSRAVDAVRFGAGEPGQGVSLQLRVRLFVAGVALGVVSLVLPLVAGPRAHVEAIVALVGATLLAVPLALTGAVAAAQALAARTQRLNLLLLATRTLRATRLRGLALAATGAMAVFGTVAVEGAHRDLLRGLFRDYAQYVGSARLWVVNPGDYLATRELSPGGLTEAVQGAPGVSAVRPYYGGFLDVAGRRAWVIARSPAAPSSFPSGQVVAGDARAAAARLRAGGWVTLSVGLARALGARPGERVTLPTPSGAASYRLAATTTNLGWSAGAIVLGSRDYVRAWPGAAPTALEVETGAGAGLASVQRAIAARLGPGSAVDVESAGQRASRADALAREGLARLIPIATRLSLAAALATAAAMAASLWQRRPALASLRLQSFSPSQLRGIVWLESSLVIATGCLVGAAGGLWAHAQIDRYLRLVSGFPAPFTAGVGASLVQLALIVAATMLALVGPGALAAGAAPRLALEEQG
jgi:putative ABC transport system permease protein